MQKKYPERKSLNLAKTAEEIGVKLNDENAFKNAIKIEKGLLILFFFL